MHSTEQRRLAIETFIRFDRSCADTIAELGYPDRHTLNSWWRGCGETGEVPVGKMIREPRLSDGQQREAAAHCLGHGTSLSRTMRARLPSAARLDRRARPRPAEASGPEPEAGPRPHREEGAGRGRAGGEDGARRGDRGTARRPAFGAGRLWGTMAGTPKRKASP